MQVSNPLQPLVLGTDGVDQFPVFETDGFTKVSGLDPGTDMAITFFVNGAEAPTYPDPVVAEIGTNGEYLITFQTLERGRLIVEVAVAGKTFTWKGFYDVGNPYVFPGQVYRNVLRDDRGNGIASAVVDVLDSGTAVVLATVQTDSRGAYAVPLTGDLAVRRLVDLRISGGTGIPAYVLSNVVIA